MMEEDKKLQSLLKNFGLHETSADFDEQLMKNIAAIKQENVTSKPLINKIVQRTLIIAFVMVAMLLLIFAFSMKQNIIEEYFSFSLREKTSLQILYFLVSFWLVMAINIVLHRRKITLSF